MGGQALGRVIPRPAATRGHLALNYGPLEGGQCVWVGN